MSTRNKAWLLVPYGAEPFAVAEHVVMEYLGATQPHAVPLTPPHCRAAFFWRNRIAPLLDFGALAGSDRAVTMPKAVVLAYQPEPGTPLIHIAVALREPPVRIVVDDGMACALPPENEMPWRLLARSCFARDGVATPIVSIARLDSAEFRLHVEANCADIDEDEAASTTPPRHRPRCRWQACDGRSGWRQRWRS
ncbi:MAG: chemotaxis protein CheW [Desulfomicrobium escambiense]|nr:chemotaxis protein CheW [Desulfomicrobium escambiense]